MSENQNEKRVRLDLNNDVFQENLLGLDKTESARVLNTLRKLRQMTWAQVYRDAGLKWEKVDSVKPPQGIDAIYSLRITQSVVPPHTGTAISCGFSRSRRITIRRTARNSIGSCLGACTGPRLGSEHRIACWAERQCGSESGTRSHNVRFQ